MPPTPLPGGAARATLPSASSRTPPGRPPPTWSPAGRLGCTHGHSPCPCSRGSPPPWWHCPRVGQGAWHAHVPRVTVLSLRPKKKGQPREDAQEAYLRWGREPKAGQADWGCRSTGQGTSSLRLAHPFPVTQSTQGLWGSSQREWGPPGHGPWKRGMGAGAGLRAANCLELRLSPLSDPTCWPCDPASLHSRGRAAPGGVQRGGHRPPAPLHAFQQLQA